MVSRKTFIFNFATNSEKQIEDRVQKIKKQIIYSMIRLPFLNFMATKAVNYMSHDFPTYLCLNKYILNILKVTVLCEIIV